MFRTALIVSGVLALIALASPSLVVLGFFLLIIPGLILSLAPTVFVYLLLIAIIRWVAPIPPGIAGWVASAILAAAIGWAVMQPMRQIETARWRAQLKPEIVPPEPVKVTGDVLLDLPPPFRRRDEAPSCDYLCAAILDTPGVTSVIMSDGGPRRRFRLVPRGTAPDAGVRPVDPQNILSVFDQIEAKASHAKYGIVRKFDETRAMQAAIAAEWTLRLNTRQTLVAEPVADDFKPDWTIHIIRKDERGDPKVERLEVRDRDGNVRLRRSLVTHRILAPFFAFSFEGGIENAHWAIAKQMLSTGGKYRSFDAPYELLSHVAIARPKASGDAPAMFRAALVAALDDPKASSEQLLAANDWLKQLDYSFTPEDRKLAVRITEDLRAPLSAQLLQRFLDKQPTADFRRGLVARILDPSTGREDRGYYVRWLSRMPVGTFASPTPDEQRIWADQDLYQDTAPFLERLADTGPVGLQRMTVLIQEFARIDSWPKRRPLIRAVRRGFARMGRGAAPALPVVLPLFAERGSPLMNEWRERQLWQMTLVRMGLPIDRMPFPDSFSPDEIAKSRRETLDEVARYDPDYRDVYSY